MTRATVGDGSRDVHQLQPGRTCEREHEQERRQKKEWTASTTLILPGDILQYS